MSPPLDLVTQSGAPIPLDPGRPTLIVNTASLCGFTSQYAGLQALWTAYGPRGLQLVAVPSNDFGRQEPGDPATVCARYATTFPVAAKAHVKGPAAIPLFRWLAQQAGPLGQPRWNFYKYLLAPDGTLATWFTSVTAPDSTRMKAAIERLLPPASQGAAVGG